MLGDTHAVAVLIQLGSVNSWSHLGEKYKIDVNLKKLKKKCPFRNAICAICFGRHLRRSVEYGNGFIVLFRIPSWDDPCTQVASWDSLATPPKI